MGGPRVSAHPSTDPYYLKEGGGVSRAERGPFLGSFLLSVRRDESAFRRNCPKRLQSGSLGAKPQPLERRGRPSGLASMLPRWALGAELPGMPTSPPSRQQQCPRRRPCKPWFGEQHGLTYLGAVFSFIKTTCQHRQKVKKMDSEHGVLNAGLHAACRFHPQCTRSHTQFFPGPFENELQMS